MKFCFKCKLEKPLEDFAKNKSKKDGKQKQCRSCQKQYMKKHYVEYKEKYFKNTKKQKIKIKNYIFDIKSNSCCLDCGENDPVVLDFHHFGDKKFNIAHAEHHGFLNMKEEIKKCILLCSNCHRRRHFKERNINRI